MRSETPAFPSAQHLLKSGFGFGGEGLWEARARLEGVLSLHQEGEAAGGEIGWGVLFLPLSYPLTPWQVLGGPAGVCTIIVIAGVTDWLSNGLLQHCRACLAPQVNCEELGR